jgi:hypothetical protein
MISRCIGLAMLREHCALKRVIYICAKANGLLSHAAAHLLMTRQSGVQAGSFLASRRRFSAQ